MFQGHQPRLSDGRRMRALPGLYAQRQMFSLPRSGLYLPAQESIMDIRDLDEACDGGWSDPATGCWRSSRYGVHARGFEMLDRPIGASVVWVEGGLAYSFAIPDVRHPADRGKGLRESCGLLDFALCKLAYDEATRSVSVSQDFDPAVDVAVRDIRRTRGWALPNGGGYPSRSMPSSEDVHEARLSAFVMAGEFEGGANGWHGSIIYGDCGTCGDYRMVGAGFWESPSSVSVVSIRQPSGPQWIR